MIDNWVNDIVQSLYKYLEREGNFIVGLMNLHGHLVNHNIEYGSDDSIAFIDLYTEALNYFSLKSSMELAKERNTTFYGFEKSDYANGKYFDKYINKKNSVPNDTVHKALGNVPLITSEMWYRLKVDVQKYGVYSGYRLAIAPTGSISYVRNCTASIAPITERVEIRDYGDSRTIYPMPYLTNYNSHLYTEAYDVDQFKLMKVYASAQKHIDQGISMTLYITDQWDTEQLARVYGYAHHLGLKTVYYVRQRQQTLDECISCQI